MRSKNRYIGSVLFYKHLILSGTAIFILAPMIGFFLILGWHWKSVQNYHLTIDEQTLYISQLEEKLAYLTEQGEIEDLNNQPQTKESQREPEISIDKNITDENTQVIPFSMDFNDLKYLLVNDQYALPQSFQPELIELYNGLMVHKEIQTPLEQMLANAEAEGLSLIVCSAYRDYERQAELIQESIDKLMKQGYNYTESHWLTKRHTSQVGRSEHHTGLAVDIVGASHQTLDEAYADTAECKWLEEHAHEYGFILRYPMDKEDITGIMYESWHYRYVGKEAATYIKEQQLCLEEFLEIAKNNQKE